MVPESGIMHLLTKRRNMYLVIRKYKYSSIPDAYYVAYATDSFIDAKKKKEALKELSSREDNVEIQIATLPEPVQMTG